jgi:predicted kinase
MTTVTVLVSGCPGSGKTTLARRLAPALGVNLISKDDLKETIFDALDGPVGDLAFSNRVGACSWEVLWTLAGAARQVVLEANFHPRDGRERARILGLPGALIEIHCACDPVLAQSRYAERASTPARHRAHAVQALTDDHLAIYEGTLGIGPPIVVDTTGAVDVAAVVAAIRKRVGLAEPTELPRRAVLMSGYPASGKSTLGIALAEGLDFGFISKDLLLDVIFGHMGFRAGDWAASLRSGRAAWALFWMLARTSGDTVLDSNIKPTEPQERAQARALEGDVIDVHCRCPPELAMNDMRAARRGSGVPPCGSTTSPPIAWPVTTANWG